MATFILVHGAFHGAWCWFKLIPELVARGHKPIALDMPGNGDDRTSRHGITLDSYAERIGAALAVEKEPVVLVGHSLGTMAISLATERWPERLRRVVYLAGCAPRSGLSLYSLIEAMDNPAAPPPAAPPAGHPWNGLSDDPQPAIAVERFYNGCSDIDIAFALSRLSPQTNAARVTPVDLSAERYWRVPRVFIGCTEDRAMPPNRQKVTIADGKFEKVVLLPTGHSPFFSMPGRLADELVGVI